MISAIVFQSLFCSLYPGQGPKNGVSPGSQKVPPQDRNDLVTQAWGVSFSEADELTQSTGDSERLKGRAKPSFCLGSGRVGTEQDSGHRPQQHATCHGVGDWDCG